jgi:nitrate reductase gamma subunit
LRLKFKKSLEEVKMKPSNRILILGIVFEVLLAALGFYLLMQIASGGMKTTVSPAEAASTITTVLGTVMGGLGGLLLAIFIVLKRRGS